MILVGRKLGNLFKIIELEGDRVKIGILVILGILGLEKCNWEVYERRRLGGEIMELGN